MHGAGIGPALGLLVLEFVELGQDLDRDPDVVILEALEGKRVVEQDVGIQDEILYTRARRSGICARAARFALDLCRGDQAGRFRGSRPVRVVAPISISVAGVIEWIELSS